MNEREATATDVDSLSNQFSIQSYHNQVKDVSNVSLHQAQSVNVNVLGKKLQC